MFSYEAFTNGKNSFDMVYFGILSSHFGDIAVAYDTYLPE